MEQKTQRPVMAVSCYLKSRRTVIAFGVDAEQVSIIGVFYGGQDYATALQDDLEDEC